MTKPRSPAAALDHSTLPPTNLSEPGTPAEIGELDMVGLAVLWSRHESARVGEVLLLPAADPTAWIFGRGEPRPAARERRLLLSRRRPGALVPSGPLECPRISRAQLRLSAAERGTLIVENIGSCPLLHAGVEVSRASVAPGDVLELRNELLLLCLGRALIPPPLSEDEAVELHAFGEADAFGIVGESPLVWALRRRIAAVARHPVHVLILGESGSGKELVACAIHERSGKRRPMVARNAATIPEGLAAAELFGSVRNYPNAGMPDRPGLVGEAHESTLFLDEFAELSTSVQTNLLRVMDEGEYQRLGEATSRRSDLRVVAATNRPENDIREDVLARFQARFTLPDLNARREDIPLLAMHLLRHRAATDRAIAARFFRDGDRRAAPRVSPVLVRVLVEHRYTTHVRELDALLLRAVLEGRGRYVELTPDLMRHLSVAAVPAPPSVEPDAFTPNERGRLSLLRRHGFRPTSCGRDPAYPGNRQTADLHLRQLLCKALERGTWDVERAAVLLAGASGDLQAKARTRLTTFLSNLRARMTTETDGDELARSLSVEWKGNAGCVLEVIEALRAGRICSGAVDAGA